MSPLLASLLPGALVGIGLALLVMRLAPRVIRTGDALERLGDNQPSIAADVDEPRSERVGTWLHNRMPDLPGFTAPIKQLDLLDIPVSKFYAQKLQLAAIGFAFPLLLTILLPVILGQFVVLPLLLSPALAFIMWTVPDGEIRGKAKRAQREFTRFVTVYLELVAIALLGNTTADSALSSAASVSDSWVFRRIRREYQIADLTRVSKWEALARLGEAVEVPALVEMSRTMRMADARVALRDQLRASCNKLRAQVAADDASAAEQVTSRMDIPVMLTLVPVLAIVITPSLLKLTAL